MEPCGVFVHLKPFSHQCNVKMWCSNTENLLTVHAGSGVIHQRWSIFIHVQPLCGNINNHTSRSHLVILVSWMRPGKFPLDSKMECVSAAWPSSLCPGCWEMISRHKLLLTWLLRYTKYPGIGCFETKLIRFFPAFWAGHQVKRRISLANIFALTSRSIQIFFTKHKISFYPCLEEQISFL